MSETLEDAEPFTYEPDFALRKIIGDDVDIMQIFTPEKIRLCQDIIDKARDDFFEDEKPRVLELKKIIAQSNIHNLSKIVAVCSEVRCQARIFGFSFIAGLCEQMITFANADSKPPKVRYMIISKLGDALVVAMLNRLKDEGGILQKELNATVQQLLEKN